MVQAPPPLPPPPKTPKNPTHPQATLPPRPPTLPPNPLLHPPNTPSTCSPPLHHFTHLLHSISLSESSLASLRAHLVSEMALLHTYFIESERQISLLTPLAQGGEGEGIHGDKEIRRNASEARRRKWAEMEAMREYERGVGRVWENLVKREEVERVLREKLAECAELLLVREGLGRELELFLEGGVVGL